jgi:hypothetical protein
VTRAECQVHTVVARWLDEICSQCLALVVEGEAMDVKAWTEKRNGRTLNTRQVEHVADRRSDAVDPLQSERGSNAWPRDQSKSIHIQRTYLKEAIDPGKYTVAGGKEI